MGNSVIYSPIFGSGAVHGKTFLESIIAKNQSFLKINSGQTS